jgi:hypothetical protein
VRGFITILNAQLAVEDHRERPELDRHAAFVVVFIQRFHQFRAGETRYRRLNIHEECPRVSGWHGYFEPILNVHRNLFGRSGEC